jgi:hypothetical protein
MSAINGGLNIEVTWERLSQAWIEIHDEADPNEWLAAHWASVGDGRDWSMRLAPELRPSAKGLRDVGLAMALERVREFCEVERPLIEEARRYVDAHKKLDACVNALDGIDPSLTAGLFHYAESALRRRIEAFAWATERFPAVQHQLRGGRGRTPSTLRDELVAMLADGGFRTSEVVDLVIDVGDQKGARARIDQVNHGRRASQTNETSS